ncbi:MAG: IS200/IS605 family element transposase accessory protein TnpB [Candidatus Heimdallarchaeota archaeon]|nr:IS200/IS605 family element transposase accessory protein TnpB [Candidatus Heimdallarchaeota archaeon]
MTSEYELVNILRYHPCYTCMPAHSAQQTIKFLVKAWKSFFQSKKEFRKNPEKYMFKEPQPPQYKKKKGFYTIYFTKNQVRIKEEGWMYFPKRVGLKIKTKRVEDKNINHIRILFKGTSFIVELIYKEELEEFQERETNHILAIDIGVNNLVAGVSISMRPFLIPGRKLKAINQWYNKEKARIQSVYDLHGLKEYGEKMKELQVKRYWQVEDYLHKTSRIVINLCLKHNIDTIVIGYNPRWKQKTKMGKRTNQTFAYIPFYKLIQKLRYKGEAEGIQILLTEESYTSKCSFIDNEHLGKHKKYVGRRVKRGLFKSKEGVLLNADLNAAGNIGRKVFSVVFTYGTVDAVSHPTCLTV